MASLAETQRRLWRLVSAPDGVAAALDADGPAARAALATWIADAPPLDAERRVAVYAHAYFQRIHDVLARDYGALAAALGADAFHDLVTAYLIAHPSRHASLRQVGGALPDHLRRAPAAGPFRRRWPWAGDLAALEWALGLAFDAADAAPLDRAELARAAAERWDRLVVRLHPAVSLVEVEWPVAALHAAWRAGGTLGHPRRARPGAHCVWRAGERVRHREVDAGEASLLRAALRGATFGELCARAARERVADAAAAFAAAALGRWVDDGLVVAASPAS